MDIKLINIGFGNIVSAQRVVTIIGPESAPIKRIIQDGRDKGVVIDATYGRRTRSVLIMDSGHLVLSALQPETIANRFAVDDDVTELGNRHDDLAFRPRRATLRPRRFGESTLPYGELSFLRRQCVGFHFQFG